MSTRLLAAASVAALLIASPVLGQAKVAATSDAPLPRAQFIAGMDSEFRKMDADKNGQLTKAEIEQFQTQQLASQARARNKALFTQLDKDKNGQLSQPEFAKVATPAPVANAQPMIARMDGNRDSQVSMAEHRTATLANFDRVDSDKNGIVTADELKAGGIKPR
ncbi:EF-hand domain-containing protein [Sphingomonas sp. NSE70-1]|uniref:EF-hand domain-containing protein n=1 Tax=Sphingomonas caseinilyticus TaxID=2908205 RepID=A0ABT0RV57_9SPHN|nr:EF-hand domain-containing protein [Sphingomonas caseinilyticus]MCL6698890.1 EF-hand domain-containing protein [Sphingomonas caseinilyticus]